MENIASIKKLLTLLETNHEALNEKLANGILSKPLEDQMLDIALNQTDEKHGQLQKAELLNTFAYTLTSLYFVYLKATGLNKDNKHPVIQELNRVKSYMNRVQHANDVMNNKEIKEDEDMKTAKRVIQAQANGAKYEPAVSKVHFEGKHTKFTNEEKEEVREKVHETKQKSQTKSQTKSKTKSKTKPKSRGISKR